MPVAVAEISLSEVLAALSTALDMTGGQPAGHAVRTCAIGCRLAEELGLGPAERSALYYALLLKDAGCSSNASRFAALFGMDDQAAKPRMKQVDSLDRVGTAIAAVRMVWTGGGTIGHRMRQLAILAMNESRMKREIYELRCDRGATIVSQMGFPPQTAEAIRTLDERWSGGGFPSGLRGEEIPLLARVCSLAQMLELFFTHDGMDAALEMVKQRRGTWFDPALVDRVLRWRSDSAWWAELHSPDIQSVVLALEPAEHVRHVDDTGLDVVARAFADIIDAKSPFTFRHSSNVADYSRGIAAACGLDAAAQRRIHRAGLLHDVGKLGISNLILDSPNRLTDEERQTVERHPAYSWEILRRVSAFNEFAWLASTHHEKLDGSGYPWKLRGEDLDRPARILVVADIYEALTADRPYRAGMTHDVAMDILWRDRGTKLCEQALDGLAAWSAGRGDAALRRAS